MHHKRKLLLGGDTVTKAPTLAIIPGHLIQFFNVYLRTKTLSLHCWHFLLMKKLSTVNKLISLCLLHQEKFLQHHQWGGKASNFVDESRNRGFLRTFESRCVLWLPKADMAYSEMTQFCDSVTLAGHVGTGWSYRLYGSQRLVNLRALHVWVVVL